jgi:hypothetical protein
LLTQQAEHHRKGERATDQFQFNIKMLDEIATRVQAHEVTKRNEHNMIYSSAQNAHIIKI